MKIALISQEYPPDTARGGIGSQTYMKAHGLAALGHQVHVISHSTDTQRHECMDGAVRVSRLPSMDHRLPIYSEAVRWLTYSTEVAVALNQLHTEEPIDLCDFPEWGCEGYIHLLNQTQWNRIPTVLQLHGPLAMLAHTIGWPEIGSELYQVGTMMEGSCLRLADAIYSSSRTSIEWCAQYYGMAAAGVPVLHTGVDTQLFRPLDLPKAARPTIIFLGKIAQNKGVELLLQAAHRLLKAYPDLQLRLLGRGDTPYVERLQRQAASLDATSLLDMPGFVARQELPAHLSQAHVFAAPSLYEGGPGFVYLEAMACGLPVIACEGSGAAEVVMPGENGFLVPPGDVEALANILQRLLSNTAEREAIGRYARQYVLAEADSQKCLRRLEAFYARVVSSAL